MHPNPAYRRTDRATNIAFARGRAFGSLAVNAAAGPLVSHVPFLLSGDGAAADLHLVRSNPMVRLLDRAQPAVIAVAGPDGYISPDWYGVADQVPTWNYVAVHLRGTLERLPDQALRPMLDRLSETFESRLAPKQPWVTAKMSDGAIGRMMRMILPFRLHVSAIEGTWKLGQNKDEPARMGAAGAVAAGGIGSELDVLTALMRQPPDSAA